MSFCISVNRFEILKLLILFETYSADDFVTLKVSIEGFFSLTTSKILLVASFSLNMFYDEDIVFKDSAILLGADCYSNYASSSLGLSDVAKI